MTSLWKDLLFLHGHLLHKDDLDWREDAPEAPAPRKDAAETGNAAKTKAATLACCASVWPRIMTPR